MQHLQDGSLIRAKLTGSKCLANMLIETTDKVKRIFSTWQVYLIIDKAHTNMIESN